MTIAYFLIGAPNAGKTTFCKNNFTNGEVILSTDNIIEKRAKKNNLTYSQIFHTLNYKEIYKEMIDNLLSSVKDNKIIVIDQTNTIVKSINKTMSNIPNSYKTIAILFEQPNEVLLERNIERANKTGKNIPKHIILSMNNNIKNNKEKFFEIFDEVKTFDNF